MKFTIGKLIKVLSIVLIIIIITLVIVDKLSIEKKPAMDFPEPLKKDGCLGLTYHRIRSDNTLTKIVEGLTISDELRNYSVYESEFEKHLQVLMENHATFVTPEE